MKTVAFYALIALNLALLASMLGRFGKEQTAVAQVGRPADYQLIPGSINGRTDTVIYMLDQSNGLLGAMIFNGSSGQFDIMQPIEIGRLIDQKMGMTPNNGNRPAPRR